MAAGVRYEEHLSPCCHHAGQPKVKNDLAVMPEVRVCNILHVEDDHNDAWLFKRAFSRAVIPCELHRVHSAAQARCYLLGQQPYSDRDQFPLPDLVLTNINLHNESALAFVQWLRDQPSLGAITIACLTGTEDPRKLAPFTALGVSILRKTSLFEDALGVIRKLIH